MGIIRWLRRLMILAFIVFLITAGLVTASAIWMKSSHGIDQNFEAPLDTVIVLGSGIEPDKILSFSSRRRVHGAVYLLKNGKADRLIFSGGRLKPKRPVLGEKMREFALDLGADPTALVVEDRSRTTWENMRFSYPLIGQPNERRIGLLTDPTHLARAWALNAYFDGPPMVLIAAPGQFHTSRATQVIEIGREALAWWYNLGKVAAWEAAGWMGYTDAERGEVIF